VALIAGNTLLGVNTGVHFLPHVGMTGDAGIFFIPLSVHALVHKENPCTKPDEKNCNYL
jgi:hypothetical protein